MVNFLLELKEKNIMIGIIGHQKSRHSWRSMLTFLAIDGQHHSNLFIRFRNGLKESAFLITDNVTHTKYNSKPTQNLKLKKNNCTIRDWIYHDLYS